MFKIRNKTFYGLLFGCVLLLLLSGISYQFNVSGGKIFIGYFVFASIFGVCVALLSNKSIESNAGFERNKQNIGNLSQDLKGVEGELEKKETLLLQSKNIKFELSDLRNLIKSSGINDDEFWIDFFIKNISQIPRFSLDYFYGFLYQLKSEDSRNKLKNILKSKGILTEDLELERNVSFRSRFNI